MFKIIAISLILGFSSSSQILDMTYKSQSSPVWCWAATSAMVIEYVTKKKVEDIDLLNSFFQTDCLGNEECNRPGGSYEISELLSEFHGIKNHWEGRALSFSEVRNQIDKKRPMIIGLFNEEKFRGHVMVISGYQKPDKVIVLDSLHPSKKGQTFSINKLLTNYREGLVWVDTLVVD